MSVKEQVLSGPTGVYTFSGYNNIEMKEEKNKQESEKVQHCLISLESLYIFHCMFLVWLW